MNKCKIFGMVLQQGPKIEYLLMVIKCHKNNAFEEKIKIVKKSKLGKMQKVSFPSDLTIDPHPLRIVDYFLLHEDSSEKIDRPSDDDGQITGSFNVPNQCKSVKEKTLDSKKNPVGLFRTSDSYSTMNPDFQVFSSIINIRCIVIAAGFKPKSRNSAVESDLVKSGKQMKLIYMNK
ncbi:hypothetical protein BDC45DRAFT_562378 [Circinella umbellata]|nr:hypothetical protein BDC45DRAFT_562378 [Circinella umbellata]